MSDLIAYLCLLLRAIALLLIALRCCFWFLWSWWWFLNLLLRYSGGLLCIVTFVHHQYLCSRFILFFTFIFGKRCIYKCIGITFNNLLLLIQHCNGVLLLLYIVLIALIAGLFLSLFFFLFYFFCRELSLIGLWIIGLLNILNSLLLFLHCYTGCFALCSSLVDLLIVVALLGSIIAHINRRLLVRYRLGGGLRQIARPLTRRIGLKILVIRQALLSRLPLGWRGSAGETTKDWLHLLGFPHVCNILLAHGQFVEEAKADIRADKTLSAPVVPRGHSCDSYLLQIHVVDVQVDFLVLVNTDIFGKRVDVFKGHFLRA